MAYSQNGLGCYSGAGNYGGMPGGLASYGQSLSSDTIDYNNIGAYPPAYNGQCQPPPFNMNDPMLMQQVEQIVQSLNECKRPMLRRQVVTVPANYQGRVAYINRRLPTPPPDIIERITVIKPPRDVINLCIEKPTQPGPCFQQREVCGKQRKPLIQPKVVTVPPRTNACGPCLGSPVQPQPQYAPAPQPQYAPAPQPQYAPAPEPQHAPQYAPPPQPQYSPPPQPQYSPPPQPQYSPPPQPQYAPAPQPQYAPHQEPCIPLPQQQPCIPLPQQQPCIPLPQQQPCIPLPHSYSAGAFGGGFGAQPGLFNSASGFAPGFYGGYHC